MLAAREIMHPMIARSCPRWKEEKEIQRMKAERGISYSGAVPVHARVPVHAHPCFSQRLIHFEAYYEHQSIRNDIIDS